MLASVLEPRQKVPQRLARRRMDPIGRPAPIIAAELNVGTLCGASRKAIERGDIPANLGALGRGQRVRELLPIRRLLALVIGEARQKLPELGAVPVEADLPEQGCHFAPPEGGSSISRFARRYKMTLQIIKQVPAQCGGHGIEVGLGER